MEEQIDLSVTDFHPIQTTEYIDRRIMGGEQEYGILVRGDKREKFTEKGWEVKGDSSFLDNGARFYEDQGHPEYASPETDTPLTATLYDRAGELIAGRRLTYENTKISIKRENKRLYKHNRDSDGNAYSAHENYCLDENSLRQEKFLADLEFLANRIIPFLATRQIFIGSGFINENGNYELSQRASKIDQKISNSTTCERGMINSRNEPLANPGSFSRLHLIVADSNMSDPTIFLKYGTMALVLDLFEDGYLDPFKLKKPVRSIRNISLDMDMKNKYGIVGESSMTAIEINRIYLDKAEQHYASRDNQTAEILRRWGDSLDHIKEDSKNLDSQLDWRIKRKLLKTYMKKYGGSLKDNQLRLVELQFHDVDRRRGLFQLLEQAGRVERFFSEDQIMYASKNPPKSTRARARGEIRKLTRKIRNKGHTISFGWDYIMINNRRFKMDDPYDTYEDLEEKILRLI
ncbi:MAG: proteasome accessory factor PafA2 family protein [Nanoarchaeota archaeon]|nr:proteasome accessory factor PafA2 family protein [Nanoarchaeota archaeon]